MPNTQQMQELMHRLKKIAVKSQVTVVTAKQLLPSWSDPFVNKPVVGTQDTQSSSLVIIDYLPPLDSK